MNRISKNTWVLIVTVFFSFSVFLNTATAVTVATNFSSKLDSELVEILSRMKDNDKVTVQIELERIDKSKVFEEIYIQSGMNPEIYETPECFDEKMSTLKKTESDMIIANSAITAEMNKYMEYRNELLSGAVCQVVDNFIFKSLTEKDNIIYASRLLEYVIVEVTKERILEISKSEKVLEICYLPDFEVTQCDGDALTQINADSITGTGSEDFADYHYLSYGDKFDGTGIKIGIVEASGGTQVGRYDPTAYQLRDAHNSGRLQFVNTTMIPSTPLPNPSLGINHATAVTSLIIGKSVTINNKVYSGVVPNATVFQAPSDLRPSSVNNAVETLVKDYKCQVINISAGANGYNGDIWNGRYTSYDKTMDRIVNEYRVNVVVSAGNETAGYVTTPAKAYNVITVGNAATKNSNGIKLNPPYSMASNSSYIATDGNGNRLSKPDVCAPGAYLYNAKSTTETYVMTNGTSYSAPFVTGMVAQMLQIYPNWTNTTAIKSYVLLGAKNKNTITGVSTLYTNGAFYEKSGAGFIDAVKSVDLFSKYSLASNCAPGYYFPTSSIRVWSNQGNSFTLQAGQKIRAVLYWETVADVNPIPVPYFSDLDLCLVNGSTTVATATSSKGNVELIEYTATTAGTYQLKSRIYSTEMPENYQQYYWICWEIV